MAQTSLSFRISRSTEDLAETIHALSQRLVSLEKRLGGVEQLLDQRDQLEADPEPTARLDNVERLLRDCHDLLEASSQSHSVTPENPAGESLSAMPESHECLDEAA